MSKNTSRLIVWILIIIFGYSIITTSADSIKNGWVKLKDSLNSIFTTEEQQPENPVDEHEEEQQTSTGDNTVYLRLTTAETSISGMQESIEDLQSAQTNNNTAITQLRQLVDGLQSEASNPNYEKVPAGTIQTLQAQLNGIQTNNQTTANTITTLQTTLNSMQAVDTETASTIQTLQATLNGLSESNTVIANSIDRIQNSISSLESEDTSINTTIATMQSDIATLQGNNSNYNQQFLNLTEDYSTLSEQVTTLITNYNTLSTNVSTLQTNYGTLSDNYATLLSNHNTLSNSFDSHVSDYNTLNNNYSTLQSNYNTLSNSYTTLNNRYNTLNNNYATLLSNYNTLSNAIDSLNQNYSNQNATIVALNAQITELNQTIATLQNGTTPTPVDSSTITTNYNIHKSNIAEIDYNFMNVSYIVFDQNFVSEFDVNENYFINDTDSDTLESYLVENVLNHRSEALLDTTFNPNSDNMSGSITLNKYNNLDYSKVYIIAIIHSTNNNYSYYMAEAITVHENRILMIDIVEGVDSEYGEFIDLFVYTESITTPPVTSNNMNVYGSYQQPLSQLITITNTATNNVVDLSSLVSSSGLYLEEGEYTLSFQNSSSNEFVGKVLIAYSEPGQYLSIEDYTRASDLFPDLQTTTNYQTGFPENNIAYKFDTMYHSKTFNVTTNNVTLYIYTAGNTYGVMV